ncbi:hypothetical protein ABMA27_009475 [Loxostege sticticalis]|uniref:Peptidase S1 domain-containing protein n=1 Tax=Loxostege sticticalis TaxID=481309 RepID=A0ABR3H820_LOXSC
MVYLRPAASNEHITDPNWLCGGVIIHERYILTSAACIENAQQFYVVSGTHRWVPPSETHDECINYGAKKAVWKCVPKSYVYDGNEFDNIRWMVKDIAVVKVEDDFNFKRRVRGCDFIPQKIAYNNISEEYENPGTVGSIAGWGSTDNFGDVKTRATVNSPVLLDTDVLIISKKSCKNNWEPRYYHIIDEEMICAKDSLDGSPMSEDCVEQQVNCKELVYSDEEQTRRFIIDPSQLRVHSAAHDHARRSKIAVGGFCENDHGGPLVVGQGKSAVVVGVISACLTKDLNHKCYGPYLYTSVWKNRHLINCAIFKEMGATCRRLLRMSKAQMVETMLNWPRQSGTNSIPSHPPVSFAGILAIEVATTVPPKVQDILKNTNITNVKDILNNSRRIVVGTETQANRPYMVYLKLPSNNPKYKDYRRWLCGGVIIHEEYILTSAACIEDAKHFYIVSGTYRHSENDDRYNNPCIKNGAKKAVWKCIPRNYVFDGHENDNIRWMNNDIAVVKVEDEFDFTRRIRGCDFVPRPICYNNITAKYEEAGTIGSIAGWGSIEKYNDMAPTQDLLEASVRVISKGRCKRRWGRRYHKIIENYMICTKDLVSDLSEVCAEKYVDCTDIMYSDSDEEGGRRVLVPSNLTLHSAYHNDSRRSTDGSGGFCENDHGGPLIYGSGMNAVVIGIISACLVKERTNQCYGPFLYTSVFKNRVLISCAIYKDAALNCNKLFRSSITHTEVEMSWMDHPDGPAKNEIKALRRQQSNVTNSEGNSTPKGHPVKVALDKAEQHEGVIVRTFTGQPDTTTNNNNKTTN